MRGVVVVVVYERRWEGVHIIYWDSNEVSVR